MLQYLLAQPSVAPTFPQLGAVHFCTRAAQPLSDSALGFTIKPSCGWYVVREG
jgi:hypothetical protein